MTIKLANNATSRLAVSISSSDTQFSVSPGEGSRFPSLSPGDWFPLTLVKSNGDLEIVKCTARSGDILTVERAQEGTAANSFNVNDRVELRITEKTLDEKFTQPIALATSTAETAQTTAGAAQTTANNAQTAANTAQTAANNASADYFGDTEPPSPFAGMKWAGNGLLKRRSSSNDSWIVEGTLFKASLPQYALADVPTSDKGPIYIIGQGQAEWDGTSSAYKVIPIPDGAVTTPKLALDVFNGLTEKAAAVTGDFVVIVDSEDTNKTKKIPASQVLPAPSFETGTTLPFYQATAPTGWTKLTNAALNDAVLRIVTGTAGVTGGSTAFSTFNAQTSVGATTLSISQIPSHGHSYTALQAGSEFVVNATGGGNSAAIRTTYTTGANGGSGSHTHSLTRDIKYADFIVASKD